MKITSHGLNRREALLGAFAVTAGLLAAAPANAPRGVIPIRPGRLPVEGGPLGSPRLESSGVTPDDWLVRLELVVKKALAAERPNDPPPVRTKDTEAGENALEQSDLPKLQSEALERLKSRVGISKTAKSGD